MKGIVKKWGSHEATTGWSKCQVSTSVLSCEVTTFLTNIISREMLLRNCQSALQSHMGAINNTLSLLSPPLDS